MSESVYRSSFLVLRRYLHGFLIHPAPEFLSQPETSKLMRWSSCSLQLTEVQRFYYIRQVTGKVPWLWAMSTLIIHDGKCWD